MAFRAHAGRANLVRRVDPAPFRLCFEMDIWPARVYRYRWKNVAPHPRSSQGLKVVLAPSAHAKLTLAQLSVPDKTNEITAIPKLIEQLAERGQFEGAPVTIEVIEKRSKAQVKIARWTRNFTGGLQTDKLTRSRSILMLDESAEPIL